MLNLKKTITKVLERFSAPDLGADFTWASPYTATDSGILVIRVARTTNAGAVTFYVKDTTANRLGVACLATGSISQGFQNTITLPVIKGHVYETEYSAGAGTITCRFYKIPSWGGVIRRLLATLISGRRWAVC